MIDLTDYGYIQAEINESEGCIPARATAVHKERYELICKNGKTFGSLKSARYYNGSEEVPTAGDFVMIDYFQGSDSRITRTLERKSYFSRLDPSSSGLYNQVVAANFDYVFIMQSLNNDLNMHRLERYLVLAWQSGAVPVIVLTKADLIDDYSEQIRKIESFAFGTDVFSVSIKTGFGMEKLLNYIKPKKTIVFLGSSGVGKSSMVNALAGEDIMKVNEIREDDSKGRHTTTHRQLIMLKSGAMIIDTPGMRQLGMWDVSSGMEDAFLDVEQYMGKCRFSDCKHNTEPGCVVKAAIENGELSQERWNSYIKLKNEARYSDDKEGYLRDRQQWHKSIAKFNKNIKKERKG